MVRMIDSGPGLESPIRRAMSIDYGIVIEVEFELTLDSGESRVMKRGDVSVQRATVHNGGTSQVVARSLGECYTSCWTAESL